MTVSVGTRVGCEGPPVKLLQRGLIVLWMVLDEDELESQEKGPENRFVSKK